MTYFNEFLKQLKQYQTYILATFIPVLLILLFVLVQQFTPAATLLRDTVDLAGVPIYTGIISDLGIYFWFSSTIICFFVAAILLNLQQKSEANFLIVMGLFILFLGVDDRIMIHDKLIDGGEVLYLPYVLFTLYFLYRYRQIIMQSPYALLILAYGFLAGSLGVDAFKDLLRFFDIDTFYTTIGLYIGVSGDRVFEITYIIEDGMKLLGIVGWFLYCVIYGFNQITSSLATKLKPEIHTEAA